VILIEDQPLNKASTHALKAPAMMISFSVMAKEKSSKNAAQSCVVTPSGFKPETF
jgi:hypothetical protein